MPEGRGKPKRKRRKKAPAAAEVVNGVLVQFEPDPGSPDDRKITVTALGDVRQTEVPALLGLARRATENSLGIGGG